MDNSDTTPEEGFELTFIEADDHDARDGIERLYMPGEPLFGVTGYRMRERGWAVFPQTRDQSRKPWVVDGETLKWGKYTVVAPTLAVTKRWSDQAAGANTAILLGPPSGNTICLDIDTTDREYAWHVEEVADKILGKTPFRRIGAAPKLALFYRFESADDLPQSKSYRFASDETQMVEILSTGKPITSHGCHHRTGRYFEWVDKNPSQYGPEHATVITPAQLEEFLDRLNDLRPIKGYKEETYTAPAFGASVSSGINRPSLRPSGLQGVSVDQNGLVNGGREAYLFRLSREVVRTNSHLIDAEGGRDQLIQLTIDLFSETTVLSGAWRSAKRVHHYVRERVKGAVQALRDGKIRPFTPSRSTPAPAPALPQVDNTFAWVRSMSREHKVVLSDVSPAAVEAARLITDRTEISNRVSQQVGEHIGSFLDSVHVDGRNRVWILKAPTGAGKTTRALSMIADDPRTYAFDAAIGTEQYPGPIAFLLPTYSNIAEVRKRAREYGIDKRATDEEIKAHLDAVGIVANDDVEEKIAELQQEVVVAGRLKTMVYRGKVVVGCQKKERVERLMERGVSPSNLCRSKAKTGDGDTVETFCEFYATCEAIKQRKEVQRKHIVFLPRAFLTLAIPEELGKVRAVIADEAIMSMLVTSTTMPLSTLTGNRKRPSLSKKEREAGIDPDQLLAQRDEAAHIVIGALIEDKCPAAALLAQPKLKGVKLAEAAKRVCGSNVTSAAGIWPGMSDFEFNEFVGRRQSEKVKSEYRFWSIILERLQNLISDRARLPGSLQPTKALHKTDRRIRFTNYGNGTGFLTLAWRSEPNWSNAPLLLLDASASTKITGRLFSGREIVECEVTSDYNARIMLVPDRMVSIRRYAPSPTASLAARSSAAQNIARVRGVISRIAAMHSDGRVAVCLARKLRKLVQLAWAAPLNVDFMHFGAVAGLDFARQHVAFVSIGRSEMAVGDIDAQVAALTYDLADAEAFIDPLGTGIDEDGAAIQLARTAGTIRTRDGRTGTFEMQRHVGEFAALLQAQVRDEGVRQFIGRARSVHRTDTPSIYILGQVVPDDIIVDELACWKDLEDGISFWDAVRRADGVIDADLLFAASPEIGTVRQFANWIAAFEKRADGRELSTFTRILDGIYVAGHIEDPSEHLAAIYARHGISKSVLEVGSSGIARPAAGPRPDDVIELALGSREERRHLEDEARTLHFERVVQRNKWLSPTTTRGGGFWKSLDAGNEPIVERVKTASDMGGGLVAVWQDEVEVENQRKLRMSFSAWQVLHSANWPWLADDAAPVGPLITETVISAGLDALESARAA